MIYGLDNNNKFYVEYTSCAEPIGNVRQELEKSCIKVAEDAATKVIIGLSSGLDSQVLLHTFHRLGLPYECAFMYHPGYNDSEYNNIKFLENKYNFNCNIVEIDPLAIREEIEALAIETGIPPEHHMMKKFLAQLPEDMDFMHGIETLDFIFNRGKVYCIESWGGIEITRQRALKQVPRSGKTVCIDRRAPIDNFLLAYLSDPVAIGYVNGFEYIKGNGLVDKNTSVASHPLFLFDYYAKPIVFGIYWGKELEYFPKDISYKTVDFIMNPSDTRLRHDYRSKLVLIERDALMMHLSNWGSNITKRYTQE